MKRSLVFIIAGLIALITSQESLAYPHFVAYGYTACSVCHYNPLGNGPLTDYGRALGATEFSAKPFWNLKATDEAIGGRSGFWGRPRVDSKFRPSFDLRMLHMIDDIGNDPKARFFPMSADFNMVINFKPNLFASGTMGYIDAGGTGKILITREHYLAYRPSKKWGFYTGYMDTAFGTRIPDHTAFSRVATGLAQNDQTHGLLVNYASTKSEINLHTFLGNMMADSEIRQKGASLMYEWEPKNKWRMGFSTLYSQSPLRKRMMAAIHSRSGYEGGASLLTEVGYVRTDIGDSGNNSALYALIQSYTTVARGLHYLLTFEYLSSTQGGARNEQFQAGPTLIYSPFQRLELRFDIQGYRSYNLSELGTKGDTIRLLGQAHVYF